MYRVLIADDEPIERMVVSKMIKKYFSDQLEVVEAVNGREAVELFEEKQCRIALLDIEMPGINGLEAAEQIRSMDKDCSIIFLTAFDEFSYAKKAIAVKALDYLLKPGSEKELVAVLEEAIRLENESQVKRLQSAEDRADNREFAQCDAKDNLVEQNSRQNGTANGGENRATDNNAAGTRSSEQEKEESTEKLRMHAVAESIRIYIEAHYTEDIALQDVAEAMNYSDAYFCKLFKQCFDKSFVTYLTDFRVDKAKEMLADIKVNIKDVSINVGYRDSNYFTKVFKRVVGVTPSEYQIKVLQNEDGTVK